MVWIATVLLAGCTASIRVADEPPPARVMPAWNGCVATGAFDQLSVEYDTSAMGSVPSDFIPVAAMLCERDDDSENQLERRATDLTRLMAYLDQPSQVATNPRNLSCQAMAWFRPWLFLEDASGRWVYPEVPTDACGFGVGIFDRDGAGPPYEQLRYTDRVVR